ncbi:hypothetical protein ACIBQ6_23205 [Nonomuraea sp. NPDC049655]|uniref:hypothetical protein n=1 Tax=Nonomuraea sp. NPDC049655 TaxID=3364355 RepID=UPI00379410FF
MTLAKYELLAQRRTLPAASVAEIFADSHEIPRSAQRVPFHPDGRMGYAHKAGVEGTVAQGVKGFGLRRSPCQ